MAEGVKLYSQATWELIVGGEGGKAIAARWVHRSGLMAGDDRW